MGADGQASGAVGTPYDEWTRANIGEVVPERMTPFSFAVWAGPMNRLLALSFRHFELDTDRFRFIRCDDGWLTYNIGAVNHLAGQIGLPPMDIAVGSADGSPVRSGSLRPRRLARHAGGLARSTWGQLRLPRRFAAARTEAAEIADRYRSRGERIDEPAGLIELAYQAYGELERFLELYADATGAAFSTYVLLERLAGRLAPEVNVPSLLHSPGVSVTRISEAVLRAAQASAGGDAVALDGFLREFGHRGWQELELANPSWNSDPSSIVAAAQAYRDGGGPASDRAGRDAARGVAPAPVPGWRGAMLRAVAARAGEYAAIRENVKHEFYRPIDAIRGLVQKAAALLADAGRLQRAGDLFFLDPDELAELISGERVDELRTLAAMRRDAWDPPAATDEIEVEAAPARRFQGVGASAGQVVGIARVLGGPDEAGRLGAGDILVVEALDIGWTPVFGLVGGIVTSVGGVLSHPCTVAREMGVPVVAGVQACQTLIRDGDRIRLDGARGEVETFAGAQPAALEGSGHG
jgi:phosphohistidine swiveling domain-containing protein